MKEKQRAAFHEDFFRETEQRTSSNRSFGLVFAAFFVVLGLAPLVRGRPMRHWPPILGAVFLMICLAAPGLFGLLNTIWTKLGMLLQKITNPIVMGLLFFSTLAPIGFLMRLVKHDPMHLRWDRDTSSYWISRTPLDHRSDSMRDQF
jgi:hypothetical protein